jgi:uncharacterized protein YfaS (alpha-2-macroglobulin family)
LPAAVPSSDTDTNTPIAQALRKAGRLFGEQNWAEARAAYDAARGLETNWSAAPARLAVQGAVACSLKLAQWDDALARAQEFVAKTKGTLEEAGGEGFLAGLYLEVPHNGTKNGMTFLRGQFGQGVQVYTYRKDARESVQHYERARELFMAFPARTDEEKKAVNAGRIAVDFDLAAALAGQGQYGSGYSWGWWWWWDGALEPEEESGAMEEADYEQPPWERDYEEQPQPTGIPLGPDGRPQFIQTPAEYSAALGNGPKIRFLLNEARRLDTSANQDDAARALFRWAMIARTLYGPDSAGYGVGQPDPDKPKKKVWELDDNEALTLAGGKLQVVTLPLSESPVALLRELEKQYPRSALCPEAQYTLALYFQTRQQFPQAVAEYNAFLESYPQHKRAADARAQLQMIAQADIVLGQSGIFLPGVPPKLSFTYRNAGEVEFKALKFDLVKYVQDSMETLPTNANPGWQYRNCLNALFQDERWKKYAGAEAARWTESVPREPGNRAAEGSTAAPLPEAGAYVVECTVPDKTGEPSRLLVLVSDIAIVQKNALNSGLIWVCDARTGQPLSEKAVRIYEHWTIYDQTNGRNELFWDSIVQTTDTNGVILYKRAHVNRSSQVDVVVAGENDRIAFSFFQNFNESASARGDYGANGARSYVITDRPVYRPGNTVQFRVWVRHIQNRRYIEARAGERVRLEIHDAKNNSVKTLDLTTDEFGAASGEYALSQDASLGIWHLEVNSRYPDAHEIAGALFRVEEYKKPEFEVTVKPAKSQAHLGEKIQATIQARYYFGAPVANATVTCKIFREDYHHVYLGAGEYDWLYGPGYGRYYYAYPWLPWWGRWGGFIYSEGIWPWYGPYRNGAWLPGGYDGYGQYGEYDRTRKALRELVATREGKLNADGTFDVEIDTAPAKAQLGDRDHRYTVEAEVRDASRRTITGEGSVVATRQEFYAFVETDAGWYQPKNEVAVEVRALTADNQPVAASGQIVVKRISFGGADHSAPEETIVKQWDAATDAQGRLSFRYPIPGEGQYRITFLTRDSADGEVEGNAVFWVNGPRFDGRVYRFNDLEIIADKRAYKVGDTAHLLINVAESDSRIMFSDQVSDSAVLNWRFIDLPARSTVVDVPIEAKHVPNFFVEATLVRDGRVHTEARELFVPPVRELLNVAITTDKPVYRPGETGKVSVAVTDADGQPVSGQVALTAYDRAVTYIQDEFGPSPRVFFHGQQRSHTSYVDASVEQTFRSSGAFSYPEWFVFQGGEPEGWRGWWNIGESGRMLAKDLYWERPDAGAVADGVVAYDVIGGFNGGYGGGMGGYGGVGNMAGNIVEAAGYAVSSPMGIPSSSIRSVGGGFFAYGSYSPDHSQAGSSGAPALLEPEVRVNFADTALWLPALTLDANGKAESEIRFPQSLTTWRLHGYALSKSTQVGDATNEATTTKNLLVRLESPRFFMERDEVTLSANVHNYLATAKTVRAELIVPADLFDSLGPQGKADMERQGAEWHLFADASIEANGERRFDWPLRVKSAGLAQITVKALTDEESDAMRMAFPALVHGINKTIAKSGAFRVADEGSREMQLDLPREIDAEQTRLQVTLSPSLAGVMIDALPYLAGYPYGCVEQTMSRFYPSVLVKDTLRKMGTDLEAIGKQRLQMNAGDLTNRFAGGRSPVFDNAELDRMTGAGLDRIYSLQRNDGGWGWWREDDSSPYQTAYVLQGLQAARQAGVTVDNGVYWRGFNYLRNTTRAEIAKPKDQQEIGGLQTQAYVAYILSLEHNMQTDDLKKWFAGLYEQRGDLNNYGRALLALALQNEKRNDDAKLVLRNILQFVERDDSNETAWVRTPDDYWWFWWNNDIEANAWALKALVAIDPQNDLAPRLVKWLLNNRRNGCYWRGTRDTALVIAAMADFMRVSGEAAPDYTLTVAVDGRPMKEIKLNRENFFTFDNQLLLHGLQLEPGAHTITLAKNGKGALYYSAFLSYFTKEEDIKGAGNEISVQRQYFKLVPKPEQVSIPSSLPSGPGAAHPAGQPLPAGANARVELRDTSARVLLKNGDTVASGDKIEAVLKISAKNTYDYLAFEDMKPAGCEPVELRSGGRWAGGLCADVELRDDKVVFFIGLLEQGEHILRYQLRAETPGLFHALPAKGFALYAPEVEAISDEMRLRVK